MTMNGWRRATLVMLWAILLLAAAATANVIGIRLAGSIEGWQLWLAAHAGHFLAWRLLLYGATAWSWLWMRRRVLAREPGKDVRRRLLHGEIAGVFAITILEVSQFVLK